VTSKRKSDPEPPPPSPDQRTLTVPRLKHVFRSSALGLGSKTLNVVLGLILTALALGAWQLLTGTNKTISQQLGGVLHDAAGEGRYAVVNRNVSLHGTGTVSHLLVFRKPSKIPGSTSDEIRIYDEAGKKLKRAFDFFPRASPVSGNGYRFDLQAVSSVDNTDRKVVLGSYATVFMNGEVDRPVLVDWNEASGRYQIHPLLTAPIKLATRKIPNGYGGSSMYKGETIVDPHTGTSLKGAEGAEAFTIDRGSFPLLLAVFVAGAECHACQPTMQLKGWKLDLASPNPQVGECTPFNERPILFKPRTFKGIAPARLAARWTHSTHDLVSCA
jgi:hypothetical protein